MFKALQESLQTFSDKVVKPIIKSIADHFKPAIAVEYDGIGRQKLLCSILKIVKGMETVKLMNSGQPRLLTLLQSMVYYTKKANERPETFKRILKEFSHLVKFALNNVDKGFLPMNDIVEFYDGDNGINFPYMKMLSKRVNEETKRVRIKYGRVSCRTLKAQREISSLMDYLIDYHLGLPVQNQLLYQGSLDGDKLKIKIQNDVRYLRQTLLSKVDENSSSNAGYWFWDVSSKMMNLVYWYSIDWCCTNQKYTYSFKEMMHWMAVCVASYPGHIFSLKLMDQIHDIYEETNSVDERDQAIGDLIKKDPIAFDILRNIAMVFDKIINANAGSKISPDILASYMGLSDALMSIYPEASANLTFRELEQDRKQFLKDQKA
ncbi:hypothetical protein BC833DRAFT_612349, partial [Globomyces pollinis-pini]